MSSNTIQNVNANLFVNRVYGVQIIKSKNSNYNADFTGSPRTLPDGTIYSTDKVNKFNIRKYLGRENPDIIFVKETIHKKISIKNQKNIITIWPRTLVETYEHFFCQNNSTLKDQTKTKVLQNLLSKLDIRLFGATFAPGGNDARGKNISIHGPVQISYGVNRSERFKDSGMYTDQIGSPYAKDSGADQTTLGSQTRSQEAHYVHHFSINPKNLSIYVDQFNEDKNNSKDASNNTDNNEFTLLSREDIQYLKEAMAVATTYYDSTSKKDSENELLLWIELKKNSEKILKNFTDLIKIKNDTIFIKDVFDKYLINHIDAISKIELAYDKFNTSIDLEINSDKLDKFDFIVVKTVEDYKKVSQVADNEKTPIIIYEDLNFVKSVYESLKQPESKE